MLTEQLPQIPDVCLGIRRRRKPQLYLVRFHDGLRFIDRNVVAYTSGQARRLAAPTVPALLYGPNVVFVSAKRKNFLLTIDEECIRFLAEKIQSP
jgi:hypothetical protein